jgi:hypothetical protein
MENKYSTNEFAPNDDRNSKFLFRACPDADREDLGVKLAGKALKPHRKSDNMRKNGTRINTGFAD